MSLRSNMGGTLREKLCTSTMLSRIGFGAGGTCPRTVKGKFRNALVLVLALLFTSLTFHHLIGLYLAPSSAKAASPLSGHKPKPEPVKLLPGEGNKTSEVSFKSTPSLPHHNKTWAWEREHHHTNGSVDLDVVYEELLDAVDQAAHTNLSLELASKFRKIEEECRRPHTELDLTGHLCGLIGIVTFAVAYCSVIFEEQLSKDGVRYHKSIPMAFAAGLIWIVIAGEYRYKAPHLLDEVESAFKTSFLEFSETLLFLVVAMTYVSTMEELKVFECIKTLLMDMQLSLKQLFWVTGGLSFLLSPVADNLTSALLMAAVVRSVGSGMESVGTRSNTQSQNQSQWSNFKTLSLINIVVACNAGGAFSPFGDLTTLMIWQRGKLHMTDFVHLVVPSTINWLVPAYLIQKALPAGVKINASRHHNGPGAHRLSGPAVVVIMLFFITITFTALGHTFLNLPAVLGMMTGFSVLQMYGYILQRVRAKTAKASRKGRRTYHVTQSRERVVVNVAESSMETDRSSEKHEQASFFDLLSKIDWDTLLFFYGVIVCVGGLGVMGYIEAVARFAYDDLGSKPANILIGFLSALIDNIPVLYAVLVANPTMSKADWRLITLTAGTGGSILSFGSAAGVGLMGQSDYNFNLHFKWSWAIVLGYFCSIFAHFVLNGF